MVMYAVLFVGLSLIDVWTIVEGIIDDLVSGFFRVIIDDIFFGLYTAFITNIFDNLDIELIFMLLFGVFLFGFYLKYIYGPMRG